MNEVFFTREKFPEFSLENSGSGILKVQAVATNQAFPLQGVEIEVSKNINGEKVIFFQGVTDSSGIIDQIFLPAKVPKKVVEQASDDIEIFENAPTGELIGVYPGYPIELGNAGDKVRVIQRELNRISNNYPAIPKIPKINGVFEIGRAHV